MQPVKTRSEEDPTSKGKIKRRSSEGKIRRTIQPVKVRSEEDDPANEGKIL